jgi:hypothetical protein
MICFCHRNGFGPIARQIAQSRGGVEESSVTLVLQVQASTKRGLFAV